MLIAKKWGMMVTLVLSIFLLSACDETNNYITEAPVESASPKVFVYMDKAVTLSYTSEVAPLKHEIQWNKNGKVKLLDGSIVPVMLTYASLNEGEELIDGEGKYLLSKIGSDKIEGSNQEFYFYDLEWQINNLGKVLYVEDSVGANHSFKLSNDPETFAAGISTNVEAEELVESVFYYDTETQNLLNGKYVEVPNGERTKDFVINIPNGDWVITASGVVRDSLWAADTTIGINDNRLEDNDNYGSYNGEALFFNQPSNGEVKISVRVLNYGGYILKLHTEADYVESILEGLTNE